MAQYSYNPSSDGCSVRGEWESNTSAAVTVTYTTTGGRITSGSVYWPDGAGPSTTAIHPDAWVWESDGLRYDGTPSCGECPT